MTITSELQVTIPAWAVEMGDFVFVRQLDDWAEVIEVRHWNSPVRGWMTSLTIDAGDGVERRFLVFGANDKVQVHRS